jgi:hypothetical protein
MDSPKIGSTRTGFVFAPDTFDAGNEDRIVDITRAVTRPTDELVALGGGGS